MTTIHSKGKQQVSEESVSPTECAAKQPVSGAGWEASQRSGPTLGAELHGAVYITVLAAFAWILIAAWVAFARGGRTDLDLSVVTLIFAMFLGIPAIAFGIAAAHSGARRRTWAEFFWSTIETATGPLPGWHVWLQILVIPMSLAFAATLFGVVRTHVPDNARIASAHIPDPLPRPQTAPLPPNS